MFRKIPDNVAMYGNIALCCFFIYAAGEMVWAAALASISAFYLGYLSGQKQKDDE